MLHVIHSLIAQVPHEPAYWRQFGAQCVDLESIELYLIMPLPLQLLLC